MVVRFVEAPEPIHGRAVYSKHPTSERSLVEQSAEGVGSYASEIIEYFIYCTHANIGIYQRDMAQPAGFESRWQLYRLLSDPFRLRLMALASEEELAVGELAELLGEPQPNVSRHAAPLRQAGILMDRRDGARTLIRLSEQAATDAVVADALSAGRDLCREDGSLGRVREVVRGRDERSREFFAKTDRGRDVRDLAPELPAYLAALAALVEPRDLAVDAGTGDGALLDMLAPIFRRVVALDRSEAQLARAAARARARGYHNVQFVCGEVDGEEIRRAVHGDGRRREGTEPARSRARVSHGADVVWAARMLHHAPVPRATLASLADLARPGGRVVVIDYVSHDDERLQELEADVWMGFDPVELRELARAAGLTDPLVQRLPSEYIGGGKDAHLGWLALVARRPESIDHRADHTSDDRPRRANATRRGHGTERND
jgi:ArsR family transcriptional regulator